jgi:hypothetical protein
MCSQMKYPIGADVTHDMSKHFFVSKIHFVKLYLSANGFDPPSTVTLANQQMNFMPVL